MLDKFFILFCMGCIIGCLCPLLLFSKRLLLSEMMSHVAYPIFVINYLLHVKHSVFLRINDLLVVIPILILVELLYNKSHKFFEDSDILMSYFIGASMGIGFLLLGIFQKTYKRLGSYVHSILFGDLLKKDIIALQNSNIYNKIVTKAKYWF